MGKLIKINLNAGEIDESVDSARDQESIQADFNDVLECLTVSARELHERLGVKKDFTNWFKYQINGTKLVEGQDYVLLPNIREQTEGRGGHNKIDYILPLSTAEHLCMVSKTDTAHEIRNQFIALRRKWNSPEYV